MPIPILMIMPPYTIAVILCAAGGGTIVWTVTLLLTGLSGTHRQTRLQTLLANTTEERARARVTPEDVLAERIAQRSLLDRTLRPLWRRGEALLRRYAPAGIVQTLGRQLDSAGNPGNLRPHDLLLLKTVGGVLGLALGIASVGVMLGQPGVGGGIVYVGGVALAGSFAPDLWVYRRRRAYVAGIRRALSDVIDLVRVCMEGGLSFEGSLADVCQKMSNPLTAELRRYLVARQAGRSLSEGLRAMANRTREEDLVSLVEVVVQGEALGSGISDALTAFSADLRDKRKQRAETKAQQATMKMLFPMVGLIFPAIFVLILGPTIPLFLKSFGA